MVDRYYPKTNHSEFLGMKKYSDGDYVEYSDYEELYDDLCDAQLELKRLKEKIADIYREM
jgi:hypothetical protein